MKPQSGLAKVVNICLPRIFQISSRNFIHEGRSRLEDHFGHFAFFLLPINIIVNPIRTRQNFSINGPRGDRFDTTNSNVNNSRTTNDKKSVFAPRETQFSDKKSKLFVIVFATLIFN